MISYKYTPVTVYTEIYTAHLNKVMINSIYIYYSYDNLDLLYNSYYNLDLLYNSYYKFDLTGS